MVFYKIASKLKAVPQINVTKKRLHSTMTIGENVASSSMPAKARKVGLNVIYFDLETTGFNGQICSMAFLSSDRGSKFTKFLIPKCSFDPRATMINKMTVLNGKLYQNGKIVETAVPIEDGLQNFVDWLTQLIENNDHGKIALVAHNCFTFDARVLQKNLENFELPNLPKEVIFADTMDIMKILKQQGLYKEKSITLENCIKNLSIVSENIRHDALHDTNDLIKVAQKAANLLGFQDFDSFLEENTELMKPAQI